MTPTSDPAPYIPYGAQSLDADDISAVVTALQSPYLTTGPGVTAFEDGVAEFVGAKGAVAVSSGTAGLHAALHVLDLQPEDEVIVPAVTFLATANAVRYVGAKVVFSDVCPDCGLMRPEDLEAVMTPRTKAVVPVHLTGRPVDLTSIHELTAPKGIVVIEDAAHAIGASTPAGRIGSCAGTSMAVFSFHPVKHITTGEGGMVMTNDKDLERRLRRFICHGMERAPEHLQEPSHGPWYYEQHELGFNYRITDIQCALGLSQLRKLDGFVARRQLIAARYDAAFAGHSNFEPVDQGPEGSVSSYHLYQILVDFEAIGQSRGEVMKSLSAVGIGTQVHYIPVPSQPYYTQAGYSASDYPGANSFYARTLSLPMFPGMSDEAVDRVLEAVQSTLG